MLPYTLIIQNVFHCFVCSLHKNTCLGKNYAIWQAPSCVQKQNCHYHVLGKGWELHLASQQLSQASRIYQAENQSFVMHCTKGGIHMSLRTKIFTIDKFQIWGSYKKYNFGMINSTTNCLYTLYILIHTHESILLQSSFLVCFGSLNQGAVLQPSLICKSLCSLKLTLKLKAILLP